MPITAKPKSRYDMTTDERIADAGWFPGTDRDWQRLPIEERDRLAFAATGCAVAYATWPAPVNCVHTKCMILRGELPKIAELNRTMRYEADCGWWRFIGRDSGRGNRSKAGRAFLAKLYRFYRKAAREQGQYDLWKLGGSGIAMLGILEGI